MVFFNQPIHSHLDTSSPFTSVLHDDFNHPTWRFHEARMIIAMLDSNIESLRNIRQKPKLFTIGVGIQIYIHPPRHSGVYKNESFWYLFLNKLFVFNIPNKKITNSSCFISTRNCLVAQKKKLLNLAGFALLNQVQTALFCDFFPTDFCHINLTHRLQPRKNWHGIQTIWWVL